MKNKLKKFNVLDFIIILLVAVIIAGAFFRGEIIRLVSGEETVTMEITFETEPLSTLYYSYFVDGDNIYISDTDKLLGSMGNLSKTLAPVLVQMDDGSYEEDIELERSVVSGTLTVEGYMRDGVFSLTDGTVIAAGDKLTAEGSLIAFEMTVTSVSKAENTQKTPLLPSEQSNTSK